MFEKIKTGHLLTILSLFLLASCSTTTPATPTPTETAVIPTKPTAAPETSTTAADSQWNPDPAQNTAVTNLGGDEATPKIVTMANGDFYITWFSNPAGENYDVRMQKYNAVGTAQWEENGRLISSNPSDTFITDYIFTKDADDNLILIFQDMRNGNKNIYAYKISPDGDFLWGDDGLQITDNEGFTGPLPSSVSTTADVAFVWLHEPPRGATQLVMQKLTPDGDPVWGDSGLVPPGQEASSFTQASITSGGNEQVIMVYGVQNEDAPQIMHIYMQKYDADGHPIWNGDDGVQLHDSVPVSSPPQLVSDGSGGAYAAWHSTDLKSFVQHVNADGNLLMPAGGQPVTTSNPNLEIGPQPLYAADTDELFVFWADADSSQGMHGLSGQKMSPSGALLWDENGRSYIELSAASLGMITPRLADGGAIVFYGQAESDDLADQSAGINAILVDNAGDPVWLEPTALSSTPSSKQNLVVGTIGAQEWVAVWGDRNQNDGGQDQEIIMQNLALDSNVQLPNPASAFCVDQGGQSEIRTDDTGGQYGVCMFADGSECDEWAFFRGDCKPGG